MIRMLESWRLMERLLNIQKRKRAFRKQKVATCTQTTASTVSQERRGERGR
jgi:hypothetical protein